MVGIPLLYARTIADIAFPTGSPRTAATASPSNSHHSHRLSSGLADPDPLFIAVVGDIPESYILAFTTPTHLAQQVIARVDQDSDPHQGCYMLITGVGEEMADPIDDAFCEMGRRRAVKFWHFFRERALIITIKG